MGSFDRRYAEAVAAEFARQPLGASVPLVDADLDGLPAPAPAVHPRIRGDRAPSAPERPGRVRRAHAPEARRWPDGLHVGPVQLLRRTRATVPHAGEDVRGPDPRALHLYRQEAATFQVRILDLKTIVDQAGAGISAAESVTVLNDWCVMAPGALVDEHLAWQSIDDRSALVTFNNGPHHVSATLVFNRARRARRLLVGRPARQQRRGIRPMSLEHADR